jgi:ABC-type sugar transport system ATPase subunit
MHEPLFVAQFIGSPAMNILQERSSTAPEHRRAAGSTAASLSI